MPPRISLGAWVFISWSGAKSHAVAEGLRDWLPSVIQSVKPFVSEQDIYAGKRWQEEIAKELEESRFGIVCVTKENQHAPWLNFEAGALSKEVNVSNVVPLAIDLSKAEVEPPLGQFQAQLASHDGVRKTVVAINAASETPLTEGQLTASFDRCWPELSARLDEIEAAEPEPGGPQRTDKDILEEILVTVRGLAGSGGVYVSSKDIAEEIIDLLSRALPDAAFGHTAGANTITVHLREPIEVVRRAALQRYARQRGMTLAFLAGAGLEGGADREAGE